MKKNKIRPEFFLGAVGPNGFHGYFDRLQPEENLTLYLLKTGPGCGKSTLMRRIEQKESETAELIHCSSDPKSLDGVLLRGCAILDATPPHTLEPRYPMLNEYVISLYHSLDSKRLIENRAAIESLTESGKQLHARAAVCLKAAASLIEDNRRIAEPLVDFDKLHQYALRTIRCWLRNTQKTGMAKMRFLSAVTPDGIIFFKNTISDFADTIFVFHDDYGACSRHIMTQIMQAALENGHQFYCCPCPLSNGQPEHLIFPDLRLAFLTSNHWHTFDFSDQKNIHCTRFENTDALNKHKKKLRFNQKAACSLIHQASQLQQEARACHDSLEELYRSSVDFSLVNDAAERLEKSLGL